MGTHPRFTRLNDLQVTPGTSGGIRPRTSLSKSSIISGRRRFHHISGDVTFSPFFQRQRFGQIRKRIRKGFVVIGMVRVFFIPAWTRA